MPEKKRLVLNDISIEEISQVSSPAQQPALAKIIKQGEPSALAFHKRVDEIVAVEKCSPLAAMQKARLLYADEFLAYQAHRSDQPSGRMSKLSASMPPSFADAVSELRKSNPRLSRTQAMSLARRRRPDAFRHYAEA